MGQSSRPDGIMHLYVDGLGLDPLQANVWVDPAGCQGTWNFSRILVVDAIREVLKIRFKEFLWANRAPLHFAGPSYIPDFGAAYGLRKKFKKEQDWRRSYYLDTILQGAAEDFVANHVAPDEAGAIRRRHCQQPVTGSVLGHLGYACTKLAEVKLQGIEDSQHLVEQAAVELPLFRTKRLRCLLPLDVPESLSMRYNLNSSFSCFNVHGLLMAGDGSGGPDSRDYRTRRCGFGIAILSLGTNLEDCRLLGHARGTVPGKQTVPRAEAMALFLAWIFREPEKCMFFKNSWKFSGRLSC